MNPLNLATLSIPNPFSDAPMYYIEETDSTMADADSLVKDGAGHGAAIIAGFQRIGRGRLPSRTWECAPGDGLLMTLVISPEKVISSLSLLPLLCGLATVRALNDCCGAICRIKWLLPNDGHGGLFQASGSAGNSPAHNQYWLIHP